MRCGNCAGVIPNESRFCGICGRGVGTKPPVAAGKRRARTTNRRARSETGSLFELPISRSARWARIGLLLGLDALLAGAGIWMIAAYFADPGRSGEVAEVAPAPPSPSVEVQVLEPKPIDAPEKRAPTGNAKAARRTASSPRKKVVVRSASRRADRNLVASAGSATSEHRGHGGVATAVPSSEESTPTDEQGEVATGDPVDADAGDAPTPGPTDEEVERVIRAVRRQVRGRQSLLERCYINAAKASTPEVPLEGRIEVQFTIMPDGTSRDATVQQNGTGSERLALCVAQLVASWQFATTSSAPVHLSWPFDFRAAQ